VSQQHGVAPGTYTFLYSLNSAIAPCTNPEYLVSVLVEDCACPSIAVNTPTPECNSSLNINLADLVVTTELGTWSVTTSPVGSNPATIIGTTLSIQGADSGVYELTYTLDNTQNGCPSTAMVIFELSAAVDAGAGAEISVCNTDNMTTDLNSLLEPGVIGGVWNILSGTPIGGSFDATNGIFDPFGNESGVYIFEYRIMGIDPCPDSSTMGWKQKYNLRPTLVIRVPMVLR